MPAYEFTSVNAEKLMGEMLVAGYGNGFGYNVSADNATLTVEVNDDIEVTLATLQTVVDDHNPDLTEDQQLKEAALVAIEHGRRYLLRQMLSSNPNLGTIYTTIKSAVDSNTYLQQMVTNKLALMSLAYTWTINLTTPTNVDRARYVEAVVQIAGLSED